MPVQNGGLGIQQPRRFNSTSLGKWLWSYGTERDVLWRKVLRKNKRTEGVVGVPN